MADVISIKDGKPLTLTPVMDVIASEKVSNVLALLEQMNRAGDIVAVAVATVNSDGSNSKMYAHEFSLPPSTIIGAVELLKDFCKRHIVDPHTVVSNIIPPEDS